MSFEVEAAPQWLNKAGSYRLHIIDEQARGDESYSDGQWIKHWHTHRSRSEDQSPKKKKSLFSYWFKCPTTNHWNKHAWGRFLPQLQHIFNYLNRYGCDAVHVFRGDHRQWRWFCFSEPLQTNVPTAQSYACTLQHYWVTCSHMTCRIAKITLWFRK